VVKQCYGVLQQHGNQNLASSEAAAPRMPTAHRRATASGTPALASLRAPPSALAQQVPREAPDKAKKVSVR